MYQPFPQDLIRSPLLNGTDHNMILTILEQLPSDGVRYGGTVRIPLFQFIRELDKDDFGPTNSCLKKLQRFGIIEIVDAEETDDEVYALLNYVPPPWPEHEQALTKYRNKGKPNPDTPVWRHGREHAFERFVEIELKNRYDVDQDVRMSMLDERPVKMDHGTPVPIEYPSIEELKEIYADDLEEIKANVKEKMDLIEGANE